MIPGPTIIRKCAKCEELLAEYTMCSGNTCGARYWTDGKQDAPMLPDAPWLVKCLSCGALLWLDEQEKVGELDFSDMSGSATAARFEAVRPPRKPSFRDYISALSSGVPTKEKEKYLRLRAWWAGNDPRRKKKDAATALSEDESANLRALALLLAESDDNDRLMKAETMRELGLFAEAAELLSKPFDPQMAQAAGFISDLNQRRISAVTEFKFE